jgi:hypothetical protein
LHHENVGRDRVLDTRRRHTELRVSDEDREHGFDYGGWGAPYADDVLAKTAGEGMAATTAYLWGRKTYEHMAAHWPNELDENPFAAHLNATPKYVVSNTLICLDWAGSHVLGGDVAESVNDLKAHGEGTIAVLGSGVLVQALIKNGLTSNPSPPTGRDTAPAQSEPVPPRAHRAAPPSASQLPLPKTGTTRSVTDLTDPLNHRG